MPPDLHGLKLRRISRPLHQIAENGDSYSDVKMAYEMALRQAINENDVAIVAVFQMAFVESNHCVAELRARLGL